MREASLRYRRISGEERFNFSCHKGLPCFATCCSNINIFLTPYDVLRMRRALGISSRGFLARYTIPSIGLGGLPLVILKMEGERRLCPFVDEREGCKIYNDRPWSCRMFPLTTQVLETGEVVYLLMEEPSCLGLKEGGKSWSIDEWRKDQGLEPYDEMDRAYRGITFHEFFRKGKKLKPSEAKMFYKVCYDLDGFRDFILGGRFFDIYDVEPEVIKMVKERDEELLMLGFRYLMHLFFWEDTLKFKDRAMAKTWELRRKQELGLI